MSMIQLKCQDCGASIDVDLDHMMAYCPYCGNKLLIDAPQLAKLMREKEKTEQTRIREDNETMRTYYETHQEENLIREKGKQDRKDTLLGVAIIVGALLFSYLLL